MVYMLYLNMFSRDVTSPACGTPIGSSGGSECYESLGGSVVCSLDGSSYNFREFSFNGGVMTTVTQLQNVRF